MSYDYDCRPKQAAKAALEKVLKATFLRLELPYGAYYKSAAEAAEAFGGDVGHELRLAIEHYVGGCQERLLDAEGLKKTTFRTISTERVWDEYTSEDRDWHVYYEATFPSPVVNRTRFRLTPTALVKEVDLSGAGFGGIDLLGVLQQVDVAKEIAAVFQEAVHTSETKDPVTGLGELALEYAYAHMSTDFRATDKDDVEVDNPIHVKVALNVSRMSSKGAVTGDLEVTFTTGFVLEGRILWPSDHEYDKFTA